MQKQHPQFVAAKVSFEPPTSLKVRDSTETQAEKNEEEAPVDDCATSLISGRILDASRTSPNTHEDQQTKLHIVLLYYFYYNYSYSFALFYNYYYLQMYVEMAPKPRGLDDVERHQ